MYGGYNTNANPFNFLEITNLTNSTVAGKVYARNWDGTMVINGQDFTLEAGRRFDIDLHTPAGANKYGMVWIAHAAPYGALQATVSQYASSDGTLILRGVAPLKEREQNL